MGCIHIVGTGNTQLDLDATDVSALYCYYYYLLLLLVLLLLLYISFDEQQNPA